MLILCNSLLQNAYDMYCTLFIVFNFYNKTLINFDNTDLNYIITMIIIIMACTRMICIICFRSDVYVIIIN